MTESFRTLGAGLRYEGDKVKGSRFIATLEPVRTVEAVEEVLGRVRSELHDARHHCWAYRLGPEGATFRSSDDGEPGGSAGRPMLRELEGASVTDAVAVVTRYFGGTKLGVGGLARAYGGAVREALERADVQLVRRVHEVEIRHPYECSSAVQGLLAARSMTAERADYAEAVRLVVSVPLGAVETFARELADRTSGAASARDLGVVEKR